MCLFLIAKLRLAHSIIKKFWGLRASPRGTAPGPHHGRDHVLQWITWASEASGPQKTENSLTRRKFKFSGYGVKMRFGYIIEILRDNEFKFGRPIQ